MKMAAIKQVVLLVKIVRLEAHRGDLKFIAPVSVLSPDKFVPHGGM